MRIFRAIKDIYYKIQHWFQRANKGYDYVDRTGIDSWFMRTMLPMLKEFREDLHGYPCNFESEDGSKSDEECEKEWADILDRMIYLLTEMNEDTSSMCWYEIDMKNDREKLEYCFNYYDKCKEEFFELFSKYFFNLWD